VLDAGKAPGGNRDPKGRCGADVKLKLPLVSDLVWAVNAADERTTEAPAMTAWLWSSMIPAIVALVGSGR